MSTSSAPRFCYVVMAHTDPPGALRLVRRIKELSPSSPVVVRFEDSELFDAGRLRAAGASPLCSDIEARWGAWSLVEAMLEALGHGRRLPGVSHLVLISGQDYPVRHLPTWEDGIVASGVDALLHDKGDTPEDYRFRWRIWTPPLPRNPTVYRAIRHLGWRVGTLTRPVLQVCPRMIDGDYRWWIGVPSRRGAPHDVPVRKCHQWMTLSVRAYDHVMATHADRDDVRAYYRQVRIPDESYLQSLLHASGLRIAAGPTTALTFAREDDASPAWLTEELLRRLTGRSRAPFARKMPVDAPPGLVAAADRLSAPATHTDSDRLILKETT